MDNHEQIVGEITALKMMLCGSDYQVTKYAEGLIACTTQSAINRHREAFMAEHGGLIEKRAAWRSRIKALEAMLNEMDEAERNPMTEATSEDCDSKKLEPQKDGTDTSAPAV